MTFPPAPGGRLHALGRGIGRPRGWMRNTISTPHNVAASVVSSLWTAALGLITVPLCLHWLGVEAVGLIGFFTTIQAATSLLDAGLSTALSRELARMTHTPETAAEARSLARSLEVVYCAIGLIAAAAVAAAAPYLSTNWISPGELSSGEVAFAIQLMAVVLALQWPSSLYTGGLQGLHRHVHQSVLTVVASTVRAIGVVVVLGLVDASIAAFFIWQAIASALYTGGLRIALWHHLPPGMKAAFEFSEIRRVLRFAGGMTLLSVTSLTLTQADKIVLSRLLSLEQFGYYSLASAVAVTLYRFSQPVFVAFFPKLSALVATNDATNLRRAYHVGCQVLSVGVIPAALVVAAFSQDILLIWTRDPVVTAQTAGLVTFLALGTCVHALHTMPFALQLAYGWTRLALGLSLASIACLIPALLIAVPRWGAIGAAATWLVLNTIQTIGGVYLMHRYLLPGAHRQWYLRDVGIPLLISATIVMLGRGLGSAVSGTPATILLLTLVSASALAAATYSSPLLRAQIHERFLRP